jgi:hypothetical protein
MIVQRIYNEYLKNKRTITQDQIGEITRGALRYVQSLVPYFERIELSGSKEAADMILKERLVEIWVSTGIFCFLLRSILNLEEIKKVCEEYGNPPGTSAVMADGLMIPSNIYQKDRDTYILYKRFGYDKGFDQSIGGGYAEIFASLISGHKAIKFYLNLINPELNVVEPKVPSYYTDMNPGQ